MAAYNQPVRVKNPRKQYQGALSRAQGLHFENTIDDACAFYHQKGIATIEKTPEPMRPTKDLGNGKFIAFFEKKAQPDYKGVLRGGKAVIFEAKYTAAEKMEQSRVTREQSDMLDSYRAMGAVCFIVAAFDRQGYYRIPWETWRSMKEHYGRKYIKPEDVKDFRLSVGRNGALLILDGLEV